MDDCLIIGGGVIGLSLAYELAVHGLQVHVVERQEPGREASWAGAGILPAARRSPGGTAVEQLAALSRRLHPQWSERLREETGIDTGFSVCGEIHLARTAALAAELEEAAREWRSGDLAAEPLAPADLAGIEPALSGGPSRSPILAAYRLPDAAQLRNPRHMKALVLACRQRGVRLTTGAAVEGFVTRGARVEAVVTAAERLQAERIVLCAGAWTGQLLECLERPAPLKPIRGQMALLRLPAPVFRSVVHEGPHYLVPRDDGHVLVGSTLEDVGFDKRTTAGAIAELLAFAGSLVPALSQAEFAGSWAGLRPGNLLPQPLVGPLPGFCNVLLATGHFRWGLFLSPGTAVVLRQWICGETPEIDLADFLPTTKSAE